MAFAYGTSAERVGKLKGKLFKHAIPLECLAASGEAFKQPKNSSKTVVFRRWLPYGGATTNSTTINQWSADPNAHLVTDGETPPADDITPNDVTVTLKQYAVLYSYTDVAAEVYEDDIPAAEMEQAGERMGLVNELIHWGALKGCTNVYYAGGTSLATVDEPITLNLLRRITRSLQSNRAKMLRSRLDPSPKFNTAPIEARYVVYCHTDMAANIRELEGFVHKSAYSSYQTMHEMELGSVEEFCFITSPEFDKYADSGAAVGSTGLYSTTGTSIDVYPIAVIAKDAWGYLALRGENAMTPIHLPHDTPSKEDPLMQRGYVGARWHMASFIQNDGWMALILAGVSALTS